MWLYCFAGERWAGIVFLQRTSHFCHGHWFGESYYFPPGIDFEAPSNAVTSLLDSSKGLMTVNTTNILMQNSGMNSRNTCTFLQLNSRMRVCCFNRGREITEISQVDDIHATQYRITVGSNRHLVLTSRTEAEFPLDMKWGVSRLVAGRKKH